MTAAAEPAVQPLTESDFADVVRAAEGGRLLAPARRISADQITAAFAAAPRDAAGRTTLTSIDLRNAVVENSGNFDKIVVKGDADFDDIAFHGRSSFVGASFEGTASFSGARFEGGVAFDEATFAGAALFRAATFGPEDPHLTLNDNATNSFVDVTFNGDADFGPRVFRAPGRYVPDQDRTAFNSMTILSQARFLAWAAFEYARFRGPLDLRNTKFGGDATFFKARFDYAVAAADAVFEGLCSFSEASFGDSPEFWSEFERKGLATTYSDMQRAASEALGLEWTTRADFSRATLGSLILSRARIGGCQRFMEFRGGLQFRNARVHGEVQAQDIVCDDTVSFVGAEFERARSLGPMLVRQELNLDNATFREQLDLDVLAAQVRCKHTRFLGGLRLRARHAYVELDDAVLGGPTFISRAARSEFYPFPPDGWREGETDITERRASETPRLVSMRSATISARAVLSMSISPPVASSALVGSTKCNYNRA